jgi:phosphatidylinositol alpha 1,6-mannosyltransferase
MRVAVVAETFLPRMNGVVNSVIHITRHLKARGIPVVIVTASAYPDTSFEGIPVERVLAVTLPGVHEYDVAVGRFSRCASILAEFEPTVVHLASPFVLGARMQAAAHAAGVPTVAVFQTDVAGFAAHYRFGPLARAADSVVRRIHTDADLTLVPSSACEEYLHGLGVRRTRRWGRGVDVEQFHPHRRSAALRSAWTTAPVSVGFVGRVAPEKNVAMLAHLADEPDVHVVVIGDGPSRTALARSLPRATFTGRLSGDALGEAVASLDVVVAPGEHETFCQVVQEAMAAGVPVVAPAVGGPRDLVEHGRTGLLYPPGDAAAMRQAVRRLVDNPGLRQRMGAAGRERVAGRTWARVIDELVRHYSDVGPGILQAA